MARTIPVMSTIIATCSIEGITPYSQSKKHFEPLLEGESPDDYNRRTWKLQQHVEVRDGKPTVVIPASSIHQAVVAAAKYSKIQIPNQGRSTWTKKFESGIALLENIPLNVDPETVDFVDIYANADGVRGSGKRVMRRFPVIPNGLWAPTFEVQILDPIITEAVFTEILQKCGIYIGLGRWRPEKGGVNGRFNVTNIAWNADRRPPMRRAA